MNGKRNFWYATMAILFMCRAATGANAPAKDITFLNRGGLEIKGDIYLPAAKGRRPGVTLVHGGGFVQGDKAMPNIVKIANFLSARGYIVFSVNYRLAHQGGTFPQNSQDVRCAVRWLRSRAGDYGLDPERLAVMGLSAGGYLSSFVSVTQTMKEFDAPCGDPAADRQRPAVDLVVSWFGVHDFNTIRGMGGSLESFLSTGVKDKKKFKTWLSPITYADKAPPMLLVHGTVDNLVPVDQSRTMCAAVKAAGRDCTIVEYPDSDHGLKNRKTGSDADFDAALPVTADWLDKKFAEMGKKK